MQSLADRIIDGKLSKRFAIHRSASEELIELATQHTARAERFEIERRNVERDNQRLALRLSGTSQPSQGRLQWLKREADSITARVAALESEADRIVAEADVLERALAEARRAGKHLDAARKRRWARFVKYAFLIQLVELPLLALLVAGSDAGHSISMDFYLAAAAIFPVLIVAGFIEIASVRGPAVAWQVAGFALPAVSGAATSLVALANHRSTAVTQLLTISGLAVATFVLLVNATGHAALRGHEA